MKKKTATDILKRDILLLEKRRSEEFKELKEQLHTAFESLKPINLIKSTIKDATESTEIKGGIGKVAIGVASGFLVKKMLFRNSHNPLKIIASIVLQTITTGLASKNSDKIKSAGQKLFHVVISKLKQNKNGVHETERQG